MAFRYWGHGEHGEGEKWDQIHKGLNINNNVARCRGDAQCVRHLLQKCEDLGSHPNTYENIKHSSMCMPLTPVLWGRDERKLRVARRPVCPKWWATSSVRTPVRKWKTKKQLRKISGLISGVHLTCAGKCTYICTTRVYTHTHTHTRSPHTHSLHTPIIHYTLIH